MSREGFKSKTIEVERARSSWDEKLKRDGLTYLRLAQGFAVAAGPLPGLKRLTRTHA